MAYASNPVPNGSWFVGFGLIVNPVFRRSGWRYILTTGFGYTEYSGSPSIQDPAGLCRGHEYFVTILGKKFNVLNRVFGTHGARKAV